MPTLQKRSLGKVVVVIQARMTSTRLPGKVLMPLAGEAVLTRVIRRCKQIDSVDEVWVALPEGAAHQPIINLISADSETNYHQGSELDVLQRTVEVVEKSQADTVIRVTSDCPFLDYTVASALLKVFEYADVDYARLPFNEGFPLGFDTEVVRADKLCQIALKDPDDYEKEHVTPYIWRRPDLYSTLVLGTIENLRAWRLVVDEQKDYEMATKVFDSLATIADTFCLPELKALFALHPEYLDINSEVKHNPYVSL